MSDRIALIKPANAFDPAQHAVGPEGAGILVREQANLALASLVALDRPALTQAITNRYGCELPQGPKRIDGTSIAFLGTGPRNWLAISPDAGMPATLAEIAGSSGAVANQSDGYAVLEIGGPKARSLFEKGLAIDLHPAVFATGDAAVTSCAHIGVILWQIDAAPTYGVALFRSYAGSFRHWLEESAAEFGLAWKEPAARN